MLKIDLEMFKNVKNVKNRQKTVFFSKWSTKTTGSHFGVYAWIFMWFSLRSCSKVCRSQKYQLYWNL